MNAKKKNLKKSAPINKSKVGKTTGRSKITEIHSPLIKILCIDNKLRFISYAAILLIGVILRFSTTLKTGLDPDSTGYLTPALKLLINGDLYHLYSRSYPYPLFLTVILYFFKNINSIALIQHVLGILSIGLLIYIIEHYWLNRFQKDKLKITSVFLTFLFIALICWDSNIIEFEKMLRPEGILMPSIILSLFAIALSWYNIKSKYHNVHFYAAIFLLLFFALMHPRCLAAFLAVIIILIINEVVHSKSIQKRFLTIIGTLLVAFICFYPEYYLINKYDRTTSVFSMRQFIFSNSPLILKAINNGITANDDYDNNYLKKDLLLTLNDEQDKKNFPILKFNIDKIMWDLTNMKLNQYILTTTLHNHPEIPFKDGQYRFTETNIVSLNKESQDKYNSYYKTWFKIILTKYPYEVFQKTCRQVINVLFGDKGDFTKFYCLFDGHQSYGSETGLVDYLKSNYNYHPEETVTIKGSNVTEIFYNFLTFPLRVLFILCLIYAIIFLLKKRLSLLTIISFQVVVIYLLTVAFLHTFDNSRYLICFSPMIYLFILFCSFDIILAFQQRYILKTQKALPDTNARFKKLTNKNFLINIRRQVIKIFHTNS